MTYIAVSLATFKVIVRSDSGAATWLDTALQFQIASLHSQ